MRVPRDCGRGNIVQVASFSDKILEAHTWGPFQSVFPSVEQAPCMSLERRRDGRVAEGARLESVFRGNSNVGSNPTLSASISIVQSFGLQSKISGLLRSTVLLCSPMFSPIRTQTVAFDRGFGGRFSRGNTLRKNGADTAVTCTISGASATAALT